MAIDGVNDGRKLTSGPGGINEASSAGELLLRSRVRGDAFDRYQKAVDGTEYVGDGTSRPAMFGPTAGEKTIYVSGRGSDTNNGLTPGSAKLTLAGAWAAISSTGGRILLGYGDIAVGAALVIDQPGTIIEGHGYLTNLVVTTAITNAIKVVDAGRCILRDFRLTVGAGGAVTNAILITTSAGSNETTRLDNLYVSTSGGGTADYCVQLGDVAGDTSEITLTHVRVSGATVAGIRIGPGSATNVLNHRFFGCDSRNNTLWGVELAGGGITWVGGTTSGNAGSDFKLTTPGTSPTLIQNVRSEGSKRFWECTSSVTSANTVKLSGISVRSFTDVTGAVLTHQASVGLMLEDFFAFNGPTAVAFNISAAVANPQPLYAVNVITDADDPFGAMTNVVATIINLRKREAATGKMVSVSTGDRTRLGETLLLNDVTLARTGTTAATLTGALTVSDDLTVSGDLTATGYFPSFFVRKTADETLTSDTTAQNDDALFLAVAANSTYVFDLTLFYDGATTGDIKFVWTVPAGATLLWGQIGAAANIASQPTTVRVDGLSTSGTGTIGALGAGTKVCYRGTGLIRTGGTAGTLQLQWAQAASDVVATTVFADSFILARKVA